MKYPTGSSDSVLLSAHDLTVTIGKTRVVDQLNLDFEAGQSWGILGPNGVGKTTLLLTLAGVRAADQGQLMLKHQPMSTLARKPIAQQLGMLTQNTRFAFDATCLEIALSGRHPHLSAWARESQTDRDIAAQALKQVGLYDKQSRSCFALSGGEQRRLALATVLAQNPSILMLDEPTNHLDPAHQVDILNQLWTRIQTSAQTQLIALHDINLATCYCSHVLMLFGKGRWKAGTAKELFTEQILSELYGCPIRSIQDSQQQVFAVSALKHEQAHSQLD